MSDPLIGIVLTAHKKHSWAKIIPPLFIYECGYENAIRRLIQRQSIIIGMGLEFSPVMILLDGVSLSDLDLSTAGLPFNLASLEHTFASLGIIVEPANADKFHEPIFPDAWQWFHGSSNCLLVGK